MTILLVLPLLLGNFVLKESIPYGTSGPNGRVLLGDFNRNNKTDVIFTGYSGTFALGMIFERQDSGVYVLMDTVGFYLAVWDAGDFDGEGLYDLVTDGDYFIGVTIYEAPDSFSYPTQEVWRDTIGFPLVVPICVYDVDEDGIPEIVDGNGNGATDFNIFESIGNNTYELIFTGYPPFSSSSTFAFGDYDGDSANEFIFGNLDGWYAVYECNGNNSYVETHIEQLSTHNIKDCFSVPDMDGDGKPEFVVKGFVIPSAEIHAFIFEATGDNTYEIIKTFTLPGGDYYGGYSDVGDVDGDSIPEIALEACQCVYLIKAAGNDSFYVWDYIYGNYSGSSVRVYDIDGNGLSEVIISGNNQTRIYEYEVGIAEGIKAQIPIRTFEIQPNPFTDMLQIRFQSRVGDAVDVSIYDVSGRLVKRLHEGALGGDQTIIWHGDDENCRRVPPGIYFIRVEYLASGDILCQKVLRVK
jgi:hypothetical protein